MTFDQWIDDVNLAVRAHAGSDVRTEELSWDGAHWVGPAGTAVATLADDEATAKISFDGGERLQLAFRGPDAAPNAIGATIAGHLVRR